MLFALPGGRRVLLSLFPLLQTALRQPGAASLCPFLRRVCGGTWALPVVERGRGLGSLRRLVRYPVACASVNANLCSGAPLCAGTAVPRQRPTGAVTAVPRGSANRQPRRRGRGRSFSGSRDRRLRPATSGSGSFQFRAGARTGSRAVAAAADILHSGSSARPAGCDPGSGHAARDAVAP